VSKKLQEKQQRRLAEERRKREAKRGARRRNLVTWGIVGVVAATVVGLIVLEKRSSQGPVGVAAGEADCTGIERPDELGQTHVQEGTRVEYNTSPPTSGDHYADPAPSEFFPPESAGQIAPETLVHNLEHGQIVFWYRPDAPDEVIDELERFFEKQSLAQGQALIAAPYQDVPESYSFTMTAWGGMQSCVGVSEDVINEFRAEFQGKGPEQVGIPPFQG
jgi:hypothetical protein